MTLQNPLALHAMVFLRGNDRAAWWNVVEGAAAAGFDMVEVPLRDPEAVDAQQLGSMLDAFGLRPACVLALPFDADVSSIDGATLQRGERLLFDALQVAVDLQARYLGGVVYSAAGRYDRPATPVGWHNSVAVLREVARRAGEHGITLGLEVVNRYESNLVNTAAQALEMLDAIGEDNTGVHLDTYHMNIEETDFAEAIRACGARLAYVHASESNRGYLGRGTVDFDAVFGALVEIGYDGPIGFESFTASAAPTPLARSMGLWRDVWHDPADLASQAHGFLTEGLHRAHRRAGPIRAAAGG